MGLSIDSPIGIFDSGVGGLTVMRQLMHVLPNEHMIYFGDTARIPYGGKSQETIIRYSIENAIFLLEQKIKLLVIACNTATAAALPKLTQIFNIPIVGVIEPGAEKAVSVAKGGTIAVLATKATIESKAYQKEIHRLLPNCNVISIACPLFVPLVEEGFLNHPSTSLIVQEYLKPLKNASVDTVLMGCTHYPLLQSLIQQELGAHVSIVDSASTCAAKVSDLLARHRMQASMQKPTYRYFVSDDPDKFRVLGEKLFGTPLKDIASYKHYL